MVIKMQDILDLATKNPLWKYNSLLNCPAKRYRHNEICVSPSGEKSILYHERNCLTIGSPSLLKPLFHNGHQSYFCIPKSCPNDLIMGNTYSSVNGKTKFNKHPSTLKKRQSTIVGLPLKLDQLSVRPSV